MNGWGLIIAFIVGGLLGGFIGLIIGYLCWYEKEAPAPDIFDKEQ